MPSFSWNRPGRFCLLVLKKGLLAVVGLGLGLGLMALGLLGYAWKHGLRDLHFHQENEIALWQADADLGYVNMPGVNAVAQGNIKIKTDAQGFRNGLPPPEFPAAFRVVGLGDSVMWGVGCQAEDTILGRLQRNWPAAAGPLEAINAGVIGYSAYQEALLLETRLCPLKPDWVLVNLCFNDVLPTEDPFGNLKDIYRHYLQAILAGDSKNLAADGKKSLAEFCQALSRPESVEPVWDVYQRFLKKPAFRAASFRVFVEWPIREMARLARAHDFQILYLLIPRRRNIAGDAWMVEQLLPVFAELEIEYIHFRYLASENPPVPPPPADQFFARLAGVLPWRLLTTIGAFNARERLHTEGHYIDAYHLSRKANDLVARRILETLAPATPPLPKRCPVANPGAATGFAGTWVWRTSRRYADFSATGGHSF